MQSLAHMLEGSCEDPDCELHNMDVAVEEQVASDIHRAAFLAGVEWALSRIRKDPLNHGGVLEDYLDELLGDARTLVTKGL